MTPAARRAVASALLLLGGASVALADAVRPGAGATLEVGAAPGPCPMFRGDGRRTGRAPGFPAELVLLWKTQLQGGLDFPAVAGADALVAATAGGQLVSLDLATGKVLQKTTLPGAPTQGPVLTGRNDRVVLVSSGECVGVSPAGVVRFKTPIPAKPRDIRAAPLALSSGGVLLAAGPFLLRLDGDGQLVERARLPEVASGALLEAPGGILATSDAGKVYRWRSPSPPALVGSLGGALSHPAALSGKWLVGPVDGQKLVFFDLAAGVPGAIVSSSLTFEGPVAVGPSGEAWVTASAGLLLAISPEGRELERVALQGAGSSDFSQAPPALSAPDGRVAFVRSSGDVGVWSKGGLLLSEQRACTDPLGVLSDGERVIVSCRDGTVAAFGKK